MPAYPTATRDDILAEADAEMIEAARCEDEARRHRERAARMFAMTTPIPVDGPVFDRRRETLLERVRRMFG